MFEGLASGRNSDYCGKAISTQGRDTPLSSLAGKQVDYNYQNPDNNKGLLTLESADILLQRNKSEKGNERLLSIGSAATQKDLKTRELPQWTPASYKIDIPDTKLKNPPHRQQFSEMQLGISDCPNNPGNDDRLEVEYEDDDGKQNYGKIKIPSPDKNIETNQTKPEEKGIEITQNYCTLCKVIQPLISKHCRVCDKCVATFDHHCVWLGNCIGEKNRPFFFVYLLVQYIHCFSAFVYVSVKFT
jgi:hypothetical protein